MNQFKHFIFALIFSISSYTYALDPASQPTQQAGQVACPSRDFSEFIQAFSENKAMQVAFTQYPLLEQRLDIDAEPEPKPVVRKLRRDQVSFPVFPNEAERRKQSLVLRIDEKKSNHVKLTLVKADTDYQVNYFFSRDSCWRLKRIEDRSL